MVRKPIRKKIQATPPSASGTELTPDEVRTILASSNIPARAGKLKSKLLDQAGMRDFGEYVRNALHDDAREGVGLNIFGRADEKSDAMLLLAKMCALSGQSTYMVTLHQLQSIIDARSDKFRTVCNVRFLFVDWFERKFRKTDERPYTYYQLVSIEEFLLERANRGMPTYFGGSGPWKNYEWWSQEFLTALERNVLDLKVGR